MLQSANNLQSLRKSLVGKMCAHAPQSQIEAVQELVGNMQRGISPDSAIATSDFFQKVLTQLTYFARAEVPAASEEEERKTLFGAPALTQQLLALAARAEAAPGDIRWIDLELFHSFKWLLSDTQNSWVAGQSKIALQHAVSQAPVAGPASNSARSGAPPCKPSSGRQATKNDSAKEKRRDVMAFFGWASTKSVSAKVILKVQMTIV